MTDTWDLGRRFLKTQDVVRTIQLGMARIIPFAAMAQMRMGKDFKGEAMGAGVRAGTSGEYKWGPDMPSWSQGQKGGYINKLFQTYFQYYPEGTDYWGMYHRHYAGVWGDGRKSGAGAGYPNLYGQGKVAGKKFVMAPSGKHGQTEDDLSFTNQEIGN